MSMILQKISDLIDNSTFFTDVHVKERDVPKIRTAAGWVNLGENEEPISSSQMDEFMQALVNVAGHGENWRDRVANHGGAIDIAKTIAGKARLRCNILSCSTDGESQETFGAFIRKLPIKPPTITDVGLPVEILEALRDHRGLWLFTGPTGNGKSTSIAACLDYYNKNEPGHILTIENPIEYVLQPNRCMITQREVGSHATSFSTALFAALRQRPDIIMIGEVRDKDTLETMLGAAESGHMVFSTMHTRNVEDTLNKIDSYFDGQKRGSMAMNISGIVSQTLIPNKERTKLVLGYEIFVNSNSAGKDLIRNGEFKKISNHLKEHSAEGCRLLNTTLRQLIDDGVITQNDATRHAYDPKEFF